MSASCFASQPLIEIKSRRDVGQSALRDGDFASAAKKLGSAQNDAEKLLQTVDQIQSALKNRNVCLTRMAQLNLLLGDQRAKFSQVLAPVAAALAQSDQAYEAGRFLEAA